MLYNVPLISVRRVIFWVVVAVSNASSFEPKRSGCDKYIASIFQHSRYYSQSRLIGIMAGPSTSREHIEPEILSDQPDIPETAARQPGHNAFIGFAAGIASG